MNYVLQIKEGIYVKSYGRATKDLVKAVKFWYKRNAEIAAKNCSNSGKISQVIPI